MNIHKESEEITPKLVKYKDKKWINAYLKEHFGEEVNFDYEEKTLKLCNNEILSHPKFITLLTKFKFFVQPSLF